MARSFIVKKLCKILIYLKKSVVVKGVTDAIVLVDAEPLLHRALPQHPGLAGAGAARAPALRLAVGVTLGFPWSRAADTVVRGDGGPSTRAGVVRSSEMTYIGLNNRYIDI